VLASIWPLTSLRMAEYLANEVPGVHVPATVIDRMRAAQTRSAEAAAAEGLAIARDVLAAIRPLVQGVQIVAPFGEVAPALELAVQAVRRSGG